MAGCVVDWEKGASAYPCDRLRKASACGLLLLQQGDEYCAAWLGNALSYTGWAVAANLEVSRREEGLPRPLR